MQQQQQQPPPHQGGGAGSPYGPPPPDMGPFTPPAAASGAMPLSSRLPSSSQPQQQQQVRPSYEELTAVSSGAGGFPDDEMLGGDAGGGTTGGSGASSGGGNRWPREETLALIRIRSEMDATFRDATLKGPLWEDVSRKLAELGYKRSAKKCKEKFENVHKYYKRTKEGRAGRQDGKSYRFFSELEALHAASQQQLPPPAPTQLHAFAAAPVVLSAPPPMNTLPPSSSAPMQPAPISAAAPAPAPLELPRHQPLNLQGLSFSSMSDDSDSDDGDSDDDTTEETGGGSAEADRVGRKRKRGGGGSRKMMSFFEGLMQQVVERQEEIQRRFLETMEKREADRTAREEAWRRQEVARLNREQDQLAQERAAAASRDAAIIAFLQHVGGGGHLTGQVQPSTTSIAVAVPMPAPPQMQLHTAPKQHPPRQQPAPLPPPQASTPQPVKPISSASPLQQQPPHQHKETPSHQHDAATTPRSAPPTSAASDASSEQRHAVDSGLVGGGMDGGPASSSRWPKAEVHALIQLRMEMDMRYNETVPKGPLWEEISAGMRRLGYNRSSKRCKEKWENINKYYKKVKESNKKRPEDSKTCPYFHQLEAIYCKKQLTGATANVAATPTPAFPAVDQANQSSSRREIEGKNINDDKRNNGWSSGAGAAQAPTSNGETSPAAGLEDSGTKKPEDIVKQLSEQRPPRELTADETESHDEYTDDGEEAEDDDKMQYRIQFQRPKSTAATTAPAAPTTTTAPAVQASPPTTTNTFAAMVQ